MEGYRDRPILSFPGGREKEKIEMKIMVFIFFEPNIRISIWLHWRRTLVLLNLIELLSTRITANSICIKMKH